MLTPTLDLVTRESFWMKFNALEQSQQFLTVLTVVLDYTTAIMALRLVLDV